MSVGSDHTLQKSVVYLSEVETVAQDLITERDQKLELSNTRNKLNEALRAVEKSTERTALIQLDRSYLEFPVDGVKEILTEDIQNTTEEIDRLHNSIKDKALKLRDLEHQPGIVGVGLKPLTGAEAKAINKAFGN